jgi:hypothetical protein
MIRYPTQTRKPTVVRPASWYALGDNRLGESTSLGNVLDDDQPRANGSAISVQRYEAHGSFTRSVRRQTHRDPIRVLEVFPPTVETELTREYGGPKIWADAVGRAAVKALATGKSEVPDRTSQTPLCDVAGCAKRHHSIVNGAAEKQFPGR